MNIDNINLENLHSDFITMHTQNGNKLTIPMIISQQFFDDFNNRIINPNNINEIMTICTYLQFIDIIQFIIKFSSPSSTPYVLNDEHKKNYKLPTFMTNLSIESIIKHNAVQWLQYSYDNDIISINDMFIITKCVTSGQLDCLKCTIKNKAYMDATLCFKAAAPLQISVRSYPLFIQYFKHENGCEWNRYTFYICLNFDRLECLKYAHENGCKYNGDKINELIFKYGKVNCLKYLNDNKLFEPEDDFCFILALNGHFDCLKYCMNNGYDRTDICNGAAEGGYLNCLQYAHENGCEWSESTITLAMQGGHIDCVKYLHENGCAWSDSVCEYAAEGNHLECLKYAHENGCEFDQWTIKMAKENRESICAKYILK